jgi:hypothetical protein
MNNAPGREEVENIWREIYEKKVQYNGEAGWIKTSTNKLQAWNGAQSVKKTLQKH